jgi:hypothetical protein
MRCSIFHVTACLASLWAGLSCHRYDCDGHADGTFWCDGATITQCAEGKVRWQTCTAGCVEDTYTSASCILKGAVCPTNTLGYQCLGERRVICLENGLVTDEGACSPQTLQQQQIVGPYCVENPGGAMLNCGWKKERCTNQGELGCFEDGSALCLSGVYQAFWPSDKGGQAVCSRIPMDNCWAGKTWCEGDILKRCDRCLTNETCGSTTVERTCAPGSCVAYPPPSGMNVSDAFLYGCRIDSPSCTGNRSTVCSGDSLATCVDVGKAVVGLSCPAVQTAQGGEGVLEKTHYGPYCVELPATQDAICAYDSAPCEDGASRCAPGDATGKVLEICQGGWWRLRYHCDYKELGSCRGVSGAAYCETSK